MGTKEFVVDAMLLGAAAMVATGVIDAFRQWCRRRRDARKWQAHTDSMLRRTADRDRRSR